MAKLCAMEERSDILAEFGEAVRARRYKLGMSQEELAERADLHRNYVGGVERGERNIALVNLEKLAGALGVKVSELFEDIDR